MKSPAMQAHARINQFASVYRWWQGRREFTEFCAGLEPGQCRRRWVTPGGRKNRHKN